MGRYHAEWEGIYSRAEHDIYYIQCILVRQVLGLAMSTSTTTANIGMSMSSYIKKYSITSCEYINHRKSE